MRVNRHFVHFLILLALPFVVMWCNLGFWSTTFLLVLWLLSRWFLVIQRFRTKGGPDLLLDTIPASHFVEKVRWCLDRAGLHYVEQPNVGTMGAFFTGRSVPRLWARTGLVHSSIGNSAEILRYLWGCYGHELGSRADFLKPTHDRVALETRLDRYGQDLQVWIYYHILSDRKLTLHLWGANDDRIPGIQRALLVILFPLLRVLIRSAFRINEKSIVKCNQRIDALLYELNEKLASSPYLIGEQRSFVDYTFASLSALWIQPTEFGNEKADRVRADPVDFPQSMTTSIAQWSKLYPHAVSFVTALYHNERCTVCEAPATNSVE